MVIVARVNIQAQHLCRVAPTPAYILGSSRTEVWVGKEMAFVPATVFKTFPASKHTGILWLKQKAYCPEAEGG